MGDFQPPLEASVKLRCEKKWKSRFCKFEKASGNSDSAKLSVYKNAKSMKKHVAQKDLFGFYGTESGFSLDKESHTLAILCQNEVVILAFPSYQLLIQWQLWLRNAFGFGSQFNVQLCLCPPESVLTECCKTELEKNVRLHIQDGRFCLVSECPPRILDSWKISHLRRFGSVHNRFCYEVGSRGGKATGLYIFLTSQSDQLHMAFTMASKDRLHEYLTNRARPVAAGKETTGEQVKSTGSNQIFSDSSTDCSLSGRSLQRSSISDFGFSQTEKRPLLASLTSTNSQSGGDNLCQMDSYTNDVFEPESPCDGSKDYEPDPFIFPKQLQNSDPDHSPPTLFGLHKVFSPRTIIITRPVNTEPAVSPVEPNVSNSPALQSTGISSETEKGLGRGRRPPPLLPPKEASQISPARQNYANQTFIDSLQFYSNADVLILPKPLSQEEKSVKEALPYTPMDMSKANYVPFNPPSPIKKGWKKGEEDGESPPPDPTNSAGEEDKALRKTPSPEVTALVQKTLPPWKPMIRKSSRSPDFAEMDWSHKEDYCDLSGPGTPRRAISVCSPQPPDLQHIWYLRGQSLPKMSESVGQTLARSASVSSEAVYRQRSQSNAGGKGILRQSSRKARLFFGNLLGWRRSQRSGSEPPLGGQSGSLTGGLDLDEPEYLAAHQVKTNHGEEYLAVSKQTPYKSLGFFAGKSVESSGSSDNNTPLRCSPDLETILDNASMVQSGAEEYTDSDNVVSVNRPMNSRKTGAEMHYYEKILRQPTDHLGHNPVPGFVRHDAQRRQDRPRTDLSRPVTGCYSVYDGDRTTEERNLLSKEEIAFGIVGRKVSAHKIDRRLTAPSDGRKLKPQNLNLPQRKTSSPVVDLSPGPPSFFPPEIRSAGVDKSPGPGTGPSSTRSSPLVPGHSPGFGLERKGTGPRVFRFPETLLDENKKQLNYCDLAIGDTPTPIPIPPKSAFPAFSLQKGTNYARIDPLATRAAKDASNQRTVDLRVRSSSVQTLDTERKPSKARRFFSRKPRPLSRRTSLSSLTDVQ